MAKQASRWLSLFDTFARDLRIISKEVITEDPRGAPLDMWESQRRFLQEVGEGLDAGIHIFNCLKSRQLGICLHPDTKVLKADLTWSCISELKIDDEVIAVDEYPPGGTGNHRKMRTAKVQGVIKVFHKAYRVTFDDGRSVVCTGKHPWLVRKSDTDTIWRAIERRDDLGATNRKTFLQVGSKVRWITKPWGASICEDGWFGGMLDGEGSMSNENRNGTHIMVCQKRGPVFDRALAYADQRGYHHNIESDLTQRKTKFGTEPCPKIVFGRADEIFRLLGQTRPTRFINNRFWEGRELPGKKSGIGWATVVSIEPLEEQTMIDLQTTTGTYIAEGFVSHNTTISLALVDVFWLAMHKNIIGCMVTDTEKNRDANRMLIEHYVNSFPDGYFGDDFRIVKSNRQFMLFSGGQRLDLLVAGVKKKPLAWGQGQGYALAHVTEIGNFADPEGMKSLEEGFAATNPHRLFVFESTAKGYNHWRTRWYAGVEDKLHQRSFFIGWWASKVNVIERKDPRFLRYDYPPRGEEREKIRAVAQLYGYKITAEQLAWIRWKENNAGQEQDLLQQNQPWTAEDAFVATGYSFFQVRMIAGDIKRILDGNKNEGLYKYKGYRYNVDGDFFNFSLQALVPGKDDPSQVELKVWEEPQKDGRYVIGFDPAYGRNEHGDFHAMSVWRCFADKMVQVAEYRANDVEVRHASWILFHLCAAYGDCMANVELGGPGRLVMSEFQHLRELLAADMNREKVKARDWTDAAGQARWFMYHKVDSPGPGYVANFETNWRTKRELLYGVRGAYVTHELDISSVPLLKEMQNVIVDGDTIGAPDSSNEDQKDDLVFAMALAHRAWNEWVKREMLSQGVTYEKVMSGVYANQTPQMRSMNGMVQRFLLTQIQKADAPVDDRDPWFVQRGLQ